MSYAFLGGKDWMGCIYLGFEGTLLKVLGNFRRKKRELFFCKMDFAGDV